MTDITPIIGLPAGGLSRRNMRPMSLFDRSLIVPAIWASFRKLDPRTQVKNPVMFCVEIVSVLTTVFFIRTLFVGATKVVGSDALFAGQITVWLWFTVLFANFATAVAEGRGKAQADALRRTRTETKAKRIENASSTRFEMIDAASLKAGDLVLVDAGDLIPSDG
ncbi:MAG TPA: potassium-transporting ATPase subunit B, partial [Stellaceae bacterium]